MQSLSCEDVEIRMLLAQGEGLTEPWLSRFDFRSGLILLEQPSASNKFKGSLSPNDEHLSTEMNGVSLEV